VIDGDNLMDDDEWAKVEPMDLDVFVLDEAELDASNIAASAAADPFDLQSHVWDIAEDLLERRGEISVEDIYEQFLRDPELPIPGSANDVLNATVEALDGKPVLARDTGGFRDDLSGSSLDTVLVQQEDVDVWGVDDAEQELRQRFGSGTTALDIGDFELELVEDGEIWIDGDSHDVVMRAIGRLNREDQYVIVRATRSSTSRSPTPRSATWEARRSSARLPSWTASKRTSRTTATRISTPSSVRFGPTRPCSCRRTRPNRSLVKQ